MSSYCLGALFLSVIYLNGYQAQHAFDFNLPTCPNYRRCESGCVLKGHAGGFCYNTQCICYYVIIDDLFILTRKSVVPVIDHFRLVGNPYYTALQSGSAYSELRKAAADASSRNPPEGFEQNLADGSVEDEVKGDGFRPDLMRRRRKRMPTYFPSVSPSLYGDYGPFLSRDYVPQLDYLTYPLTNFGYNYPNFLDYMYLNPESAYGLSKITSASPKQVETSDKAMGGPQINSKSETPSFEGGGNSLTDFLNNIPTAEDVAKKQSDVKSEADDDTILKFTAEATPPRNQIESSNKNIPSPPTDSFEDESKFGGAVQNPFGWLYNSPAKTADYNKIIATGPPRSPKAVPVGLKEPTAGAQKQTRGQVGASTVTAGYSQSSLPQLKQNMEISGFADYGGAYLPSYNSFLPDFNSNLQKQIQQQLNDVQNSMQQSLFGLYGSYFPSYSDFSPFIQQPGTYGAKDNEEPTVVNAGDFENFRNIDPTFNSFSPAVNTPFQQAFDRGSINFHNARQAQSNSYAIRTPQNTGIETVPATKPLPDYNGFNPSYGSYPPAENTYVLPQQISTQFQTGSIPTSQYYGGFYPSYGSYQPSESSFTMPQQQQQQQQQQSEAQNFNPSWAWDTKQGRTSDVYSDVGFYPSYGSFMPSGDNSLISQQQQQQNQQQQLPRTTIPSGKPKKSQSNPSFSEWIKSYTTFNSYLPGGANEGDSKEQQKKNSLTIGGKFSDFSSSGGSWGRGESEEIVSPPLFDSYMPSTFQTPKPRSKALRKKSSNESPYLWPTYDRQPYYLEQEYPPKTQFPSQYYPEDVDNQKFNSYEDQNIPMSESYDTLFMDDVLSEDEVAAIETTPSENDRYQSYEQQSSYDPSEAYMTDDIYDEVLQFANAKADQQVAEHLATYDPYELAIIERYEGQKNLMKKGSKPKSKKASRPFAAPIGKVGGYNQQKDSDTDKWYGKPTPSKNRFSGSGYSPSYGSFLDLLYGDNSSPAFPKRLTPPQKSVYNKHVPARKYKPPKNSGYYPYLEDESRWGVAESESNAIDYDYVGGVDTMGGDDRPTRKRPSDKDEGQQKYQYGTTKHTWKGKPDDDDYSIKGGPDFPPPDYDGDPQPGPDEDRSSQQQQQQQQQQGSLTERLR